MLLASASADATPQVFFDVDFSSPVHTVGREPRVSRSFQPPDRPSSLGGAGRVTVEAAAGALQDQPVLLGPGQIIFRFPFGGGPDRITVQADFALTSLSSLILFLDTPKVQTLTLFESGAQIRQSGPNAAQIFRRIPVEPGVRANSLRVDANLDLGSWAIHFNDEEVHRGIIFDEGEGVRTVRFSSLGNVAVDNILITALPEPSVAACWLVAVGALVVRRRSRAT